MRCSKSCYLCNLGLADLFDVVEQVVFFRNDFLVDRTAHKSLIEHTRALNTAAGGALLLYRNVPARLDGIKVIALKCYC